MDAIVSSFDDFKCPACSTGFPVEEVMSLCEEPYNGTVIECAGCKAQFNATLLVNLVRL